MSHGIPYNENDYFIYESGDAALKSQLLILTVDAEFHAENNEGIERILQSVDAIKTGANTWLIETKMTAAQIVNEIRRFLAAQEYVYAFTVCNQCSWAGPRVAGKFFEASGAHIQHVEEIPPPVRPETEP